MKAKHWLAIATIGLAISGCATNKAIVRERAAADMDCDANEIKVEFVERPYVGVTRYRAQGCGFTRRYVCEKWYNLYSIPVTGIPLIVPPPCERDKS